MNGIILAMQSKTATIAIMVLDFLERKFIIICAPQKYVYERNYK